MPARFIRKARPNDVPAIFHFIEEASRTDRVIARNHYEIYSNLRDFFVYDQGHAGTISDCRTCHTSTPSGPGPHGLFAALKARSSWQAYR